ncbi:YihY/virulence factor BrkB family protein [Mycolicibacterium vaccae]|uniref:YihY/virulence factor BrkB family protein n=1 Tax=Mycolicibacterium vaccae TaxID=1810 RepID=UPI003D03B411
MQYQSGSLAPPPQRRRPGALIGAFLTGLAAGALTTSRARGASAAAPPRTPVSAPPADGRVSPEPEPPETPPDTGGDPNDGVPPPDDPVKPQSPTELTRPSTIYVLRQTVGEFSRDQCMDLAAALTYYAVLSLFPAIVVMMSLLGLFGQDQRTADALLQIVGDVSPGAAVDTLRQPIEQIVSASTAGLTLVIGLLGALWSASGFVGAFSRAMNRIYEVEEGRPAVKLRLQQLLITFAGLIIAAAVAFLLAVSGPVAEAIGGYIGLGSTALTVWNVVRWPVVLLLVVLGVAMLYRVSPNVQQPKFRWISVGAAVAILTWVVASVLFGLYVANFSSYDRTFGALAGVIVFLLWVWITNLALLFGAEIDAELERGRQLQAGIPAEDTLKLPLRDTSAIDKVQEQSRKDRARGRLLRRSRGHRS